MEEIGPQVASPMFIHQDLGGRFPEQHTMAKKRSLAQNFQYQQQQYNWNPKAWDWNSVNFVAKPLESNGLHTGSVSQLEQQKENDRENRGFSTVSKGNESPVVEDDESLTLQLGGGLNSSEEPVTRPNKKVRSGSPGSGGNYPMCQVDDCKEDLTNAKDYHRRHKVCEVHSKASKALVGKQMQRFCQQCSRFHPLSEFDEGKRSCRRRLAGHNRRRRKTQPEDASSQTVIPNNHNNVGKGDLDIVNLLTVLARIQGKEVKSSNCASVPNKDQLIQILSKMNSVHPPMTGEAQLSGSGSLTRGPPGQLTPDNLNRLNGGTSSPSTKDLLAVLTSNLTPSNPGKTKLVFDLNEQEGEPVEFPSAGGESSTSYQSPGEDSDCQLQETRSKLPLQLFSSSPEDSTPPKLAGARKYFSSDSSNPIEEMSPSSSPPVVQKLFPMQTSREIELERIPSGRELKTNIEASMTSGHVRSLELFGGSNNVANSGSCQTLPYQAGYTSSSGSDHSPSTLSSDAQDRTGRIVFKLFGKDPGQLPETLRSQIYAWLSRSPSEMESHIRPGCVVLTIYISMSSSYWEQLEQNLIRYVNALIRDPDTDFWRNGKFLVQAGRQLVSYHEGKIRLCKSWSAPEIISVSPLAVVGGEEASLLLRGRNLSTPGTRIHCTSGNYLSKEVQINRQEGLNDEISLVDFRQGTNSGVLGRFFIEVENGFKGTSFPVIIADATICQEVRLLESEFEVPRRDSTSSEDQIHDFVRPRSQEEVLHFLNELGWLFQRKTNVSIDVPGYRLSRFRFLFIFSVERDCCALVRTLLDIFIPKNPSGIELSADSLEMLSEVQLLNRAVKRRCRKMVDMLIHYSVITGYGASTYIFLPNLAGPGGITPLHLAASMTDLDDIVDVLTSDPQEIGLQSWNSLLDANGQSPHSYALMRNNHSYNSLVARKLVGQVNRQVSISISGETEHQENTLVKRKQSTCSKCIAAKRYSWSKTRSRTFLHGPSMLSVLAIAAVCVCVCLLLRGNPQVALNVPFKWENVDFGSI